ncbi:MAG: Carbonic anhydrase [Cyanobacteria bacterium RYN_339]|nr:Carbonic anhydrase [Cyanobacteria bacterium RYN_339]
MQKLIAGLAMFQARLFHAQRPLFERLARGQAPETLFITCSDSRIDPCLLTQTAPGELFILRNAGNLIPSYGASDCGASATIEYAVRALGVKDVIVCGHSHCGAMQAVLDPSTLADLPAMASWLGHAGAPADGLQATVQANVVAQLANLRTHPAVLTRLQRGDLRLHGWVYEFEHGTVQTYDPDDQSFRHLLPDLTAAG